MKTTFSVLLSLTALSLVSFTDLGASTAPAEVRLSGRPDDASPITKKAKETTYKVDTQQSKLRWTGKKVTGEHTGLVPISGGTVLLTDNGRLKGGTFEISLKDLTVTDLTDPDYNAKLVGHLKNDDFFAVEKYPTAQFAITSVAPTGDGNYDVTGKLTIKGITNDVKFPAQVKTEPGKLMATGKVTVDRTKYNIKFRSKNFFENLGDKAINDDFTLDVTLVATPGVVASAKTGR